MKKQHIGVLYNQPLAQGEEFWESSTDVLRQVEAVEGALKELGHFSVRIPFAGGLDLLLDHLRKSAVEIVVNLCESVAEDPRFIGHPAAVLELLKIPFTGSPSIALSITTDKLLVKQLLQANGIQTPGYVVYDEEGFRRQPDLHFPVIVKPRFQDASIGIEQDSICKNKEQLIKTVKQGYKNHGDLIVEEFISGREFNVSLLGFPAAVVLPIGEIDFSAFPSHLYPIVGYKAKWDSSSFEYHHTPRVFSKTMSLSLLKSMEKIARDCFRILLLRDYGRVDFRLDKNNRIYVLEVNANPCLSPDAGFAAAAAKDNISYAQLINTLLTSVSRRI